MGSAIGFYVNDGCYFIYFSYFVSGWVCYGKTGYEVV